MQDIADRLGISKNSVSLALAGDRGVSMETRRKVLAVARELGYSRGRRAQSARGTTAVAVVFQERLLHPPATLFYGPILQFLQQELADRNATLSLFGVSPEDESAERVPPTLRAGVQGIIVLSRLRSEYLEALAALAPMVLVDHYDSTFPCDKVTTENELGAYLAVRHLVTTGHRAIGYVGEIQRAPSYRERWTGYRAAMARLGLDVRPEWERLTVVEEAVGGAVSGATTDPTAWFCANDIYASNLVQHLKASGVAVPEDVAVVGFDDLPLTLTTSPSLTSLHVDPRYYAQQVVDQLMNRLEHPDRPGHVLRIAPRLVIRESAPAASLAWVGPGAGDL